MGAVNSAACRLGGAVTTFCLILVLASNASAQTCPNTLVNGDQDIWIGAGSMTENWYRNMFADSYNLHKGDWDEGWGWSKHNNPDPDRWEFPKMMSAGRLLWSAINDTPGTETFLSQGGWSVRTIFEGADTSAQPYPATRAVSRTPDEVDLLYADSSGELIHVLYSGSPWDPGTAPPASASVSVSDLVANSKNAFRISGPPEVFVNSRDNLEIVARQTNALLHFRWSRSAGWSVQDATTLTVRPSLVNGSDRYFISSDPVILRRSSFEFDVFALDNFRHLIHYLWDGSGWFAEDVTHKLQDGFTLTDDPVPVRRADGTIDVFGRNSLGRLIHYKRDTGSGWSSEEVTAAIAGLATNERVDSQPAVVSPDGQAILVYYRVGYKLYMLVRVELFNDWIRLQIADDYAIVSDPVIVKRKHNAVHGFVRDLWTSNLIHFFFMPELGFGAERLSPSGIDDNPTVVISNENRLDLFARNGVGHLIHLYWADPGGWRDENINLTPGVSPTFNTVGPGRAGVIRGESALEVFGERLSFPNRTVHFTSALGPSISSWHTNEEYWQWASGTLHGFKYTAANSNDARANALRSFWVRDRVEMECPIFVATPASRAGTMVHESTHMIFWRFSHQANLPGSSCGNPCSDNWFFHGARHPAGSLIGILNHSMNQVQIEYLTDISELPAWWTPSRAFAGAQTEATNRMNNRILNPPGWTPGTPRPLN